MSAEVARGPAPPEVAQEVAQGLAAGALPGKFYGWLGAASVSVFGDAVLYFALGWAATGIGPAWAGLVFTMILLPRAVLLLLGGAAGDRWGARRVMIVGDAAMCGLALLLALSAHVWGAKGPLLVSAGLAIGVIDAFYLPATGSFPRLLVPDEQLSRALSLRQSAAQIVGLLGAPASGALVAAGGLVVAAVVDASTFAVVLVALLVVRPQRRPPQPAAGTSVLRDAASGVRLVLADPSLRALLAATGLVAAFVLPMTSLCVPLLVRGHGWSSSAAGFIVAASAGGALAVSLIVARWGAFGRAGLVAGVGPLVASIGMAGIAIGTTTLTTFLGALVQGIGVGLFVSHMAPLVMAGASRTHLARVQSMLSLAQTLPLLFSNNVVAILASHTGATVAALACAGGTAAAGLRLITHPQVRNATPATSSSPR